MQVSRGGVNSYTYIWRRGGALQIWLDGTVLLVEKRHVWHKVLDNVHVGERVDARFLGGVGGNAAYCVLLASNSHMQCDSTYKDMPGC